MLSLRMGLSVIIGCQRLSESLLTLADLCCVRLETVAASMGKLVRPKDRAKATPPDVARGLLDCVTNNIVSSWSGLGL